MRTWSRVAVGVTLLVVACGVAAAQGDVAQREAKLRTLLVEKLGEDAATVRVTLNGSTAILTGEVKLRSTEELSEEVALFFSGVKKVDNQVKAVHDEKFGTTKVKDETADADLEMTVKMKLRAEIGLHAEKIEVEACDGVVSLRGVAPEEARKEIALKTAAAVKGVKKVIDLLRIE